MSQGKNRVRALVLAVGVLLCGAQRAGAANWYANGVGGFNPTLPDFYQHQDYISGLNFLNGANGTNGWEPGGGWCEYTAYSDAMYDLTTRGYSGLFSNNPLAGWQNAMYGPNNTAAGVGQSNIARLVGTMSTPAIRNNWQAYLNTTVNLSAAVQSGAKAPLISNTLPTAGNGNVLFYNAFGQTQSTGQSVTKFTNNAVKYLGSEVLYRLRSGTANLAPNANGQSVWWGGNGPGAFHYVALAGIDTVNGSVSVADPDTNPGANAGNTGSNPAAAGWPKGQKALNINFPFSSPGGSALPVAAAPNVQNFADFTFTGRTVSSVAAPQYNNTAVQSVNLIAPLNVRGARQVLSAHASQGLHPAALPTADNDEDLTITVPEDADEPVDKVMIEPSSMVSDPTAEPTEFSLTDDTGPAGTWTDAAEANDPFGNTMADGGIEYDLSTGTPLEAGDTADVDIATASDFTTSGYDVFLHFEGDASDPAGEWVPEEIGGTDFDPEDTADIQDAPEPGSLMILGVACGLSMIRRRREATK